MNQSMSVKGWLEDHDFAVGKGHGKNSSELTWPGLLNLDISGQEPKAAHKPFNTVLSTQAI